MAKKTDARDIFDKALDPDNHVPVLGAIYGAALGGLAGRGITRRVTKKMRKGDEVVTPYEVVLVPVGATAGMALGQKHVENSKLANRRK